ncbi:MAG: hypothetical protein P8189_08755 [Anaerolineae bacterium]|jgi:hypothetical protein
MIQVRTRVKPDPMTTSRPWPASDDGALLVAALAATLVEFRRAARQRNGQVRAGPAGPKWCTVARLEQLRGQR